MIYNLSMFGKIVFVITLNYDVIGIQATGSFEKCDRTVFEIVSSTDDFETIKDGITLLARLLQYSLSKCMLCLMRDMKFEVCFFDKSKAFDKIWHEDLILKLNQNGISGKLLRLIKDFLSNRKQRVVLIGYGSFWMNVQAGLSIF